MSYATFYGDNDKTHWVHETRVNQLGRLLGGDWAFHKPASAEQGYYYCTSLSPMWRDMMFANIAQAGFGVQRIPDPTKESDAQPLVLALTEDCAARLLSTRVEKLRELFGPTTLLNRIAGYESTQPFRAI